MNYMKLCRQCNSIKAIKDFNISASGRVSFHCQQCHESPPELPESKACSICAEVLPLECFWKKGHGKLRSACKVCSETKPKPTKSETEKVEIIPAFYDDNIEPGDFVGSHSQIYGHPDPQCGHQYDEIY